MITYWNIVTQETIDSLNLSKSKPDRDLVGQLIKVQSPSGEIMRNEMIDNFLKKCSKKYENQFKAWYKKNYETALGVTDRAKGLKKMFAGRYLALKRFFIMNELMWCIK